MEKLSIDQYKRALRSSRSPKQIDTSTRQEQISSFEGGDDFTLEQKKAIDQLCSKFPGCYVEWDAKKITITRK